MPDDGSAEWTSGFDANLIYIHLVNRKGYCETVRSGPKKFPPCLFDQASTKSMKRGDVLWCMKGPVLAVTRMDKKHAAGTYTQTPMEILPEVNRKQKDGTTQ